MTDSEYKNIFAGEGITAQLAMRTYALLMSREWVSYTKIMQEYKERMHEGDIDEPVSKWYHKSALKKAVTSVMDALTLHFGEKQFIEYNPESKREFLYIGKEENPLGFMTEEVMREEIERFWNFCNDTYSFIPKEWLEYFFKNSKSLLQISNKRKLNDDIISTSIDRQCVKKNLLPQLYEAIKKKQVLRIYYKEAYETEVELIFHPHYIKEYAGRWQVLGHAEGREPEWGYQLSLDRIANEKFFQIKDVEYKEAPFGFYHDFFKDFIGLTRPADSDKLQSIKIRTRDKYAFGLMKTKPLHPSQRIVRDFHRDIDGEYGEFEFYLYPNKEFYGNILLKGDLLEIISPKEVRDEMARRVQDIYNMYFSIVK